MPAQKHHRSFARWLAKQEHNPKYRNAARYFNKLHTGWPEWSDDKAIAEVYKEARRRRDAGEDVVVDHIVPLSHAYVCGLHVPDNLQIVTWKANSVKSNDKWPDMWNAPGSLDLEHPGPYQLMLCL